MEYDLRCLGRGARLKGLVGMQGIWVYGKFLQISGSLGFRVEGLGFRVWSMSFWAWGLEFRMKDWEMSGFRIYNLWLRVEGLGVGLGFRTWVFEFRI